MFGIEEREAEREELKKLARELRKLIPNHKFRVGWGNSTLLFIDDRVSVGRNYDETFEDLKNWIIANYRK